MSEVKLRFGKIYERDILRAAEVSHKKVHPLHIYFILLKTLQKNVSNYMYLKKTKTDLQTKIISKNFKITAYKILKPTNINMNS